MAWTVEEHCLEITVIYMSVSIYECLTLRWNLDKAGMLYSGHLSVACTFSWNHENN